MLYQSNEGVGWMEFSNKLVDLKHLFSILLHNPGLKTIAEFAGLINLSTDQFVEKLKANGFEIDSLNQTIKELALKYDKAPSDIYALTIRESTPEITEHTVLSGSGYGRKTLSEISEDLGVDINRILIKLEAKGITAESTDKLKDVSVKLDMLPYDLLEYLKTDKS